MTDQEKAKMRFVSTGEGVSVVFVAPCAVCENVDGYFCKKMSGKRPTKYYYDDPNFQKCSHFKFNSQAFYAERFKDLSKDYNW